MGVFVVVVVVDAPVLLQAHDQMRCATRQGERMGVASALWEIVPEEKRCDCAFGAYISYTFA